MVLWSELLARCNKPQEQGGTWQEPATGTQQTDGQPTWTARVSGLPGLPDPLTCAARPCKVAGSSVTRRGVQLPPARCADQPSLDLVLGRDSESWEQWYKQAFALLAWVHSQPCSEEAEGLHEWRCGWCNSAEKAVQKTACASAYRIQEWPCLPEQNVHFSGGCCLIRLLLMLTLCAFSLLYLLSFFIISYFGLMLLVYKI